MALAAGTRLGPYEILAPLGAGGMGEVYRAKDAKLEREVAIKVLPPEVSRDPERLARFGREAKVLASLNHPNVAAIHGLEESKGEPFLVLELVEGETLRERLGRGLFPLDEALEVARQVARALEEAHSKGVVHRDLKPANIKLSPDGSVKVLDFGLAKAYGGDSAAPSPADLSQSPTETQGPTAAGVILGTAAYMSPEQARGRPVDKRTDIWSFGVVLFEMLSGRGPFRGDTLSDTLAAVLEREVDWSRLPPTTPAGVRRLLRRCLQRDRGRRLHDIADARIEIEEASSGSPGAEAEGAPGGAERSSWWPCVVAGVMTATAAGIAVVHFTETAERPAPVHFILDTGGEPSLDEIQSLAVSPDGRYIALAARAEGQPRQLWLRSLETPDIRPLPGTEGARQPMWSPDGEWIGFFTDSSLEKVSLSGGAVQRICLLPAGDSRVRGGTWGEGGVILFSHPQMSSRIYSVPAIGGEATVLTDLDESRAEILHHSPRLVAGGRHFLFTVTRSDYGSDVVAASLTAPDGRRPVLEGVYSYGYAASGHLTFVRRGILMAQTFDADGLRLEGEPVPVSPATAFWTEGSGDFSASANGVVAWLSETTHESQLAWVDRAGATVGTVGEPGLYRQLALSPDGRRVAVEVATGQGRRGLRVVDVDRGASSQATAGGRREINPVWSPDSRDLIFQSRDEDWGEDGRWRFFSVRPEGGEPASLLWESDARQTPESWSLHGPGLLYNAGWNPTDRAVWAFPMDGSGNEPVLVLQKGRIVDEPTISPDGRWIAYVIFESSGTSSQVYVEPYGRPGRSVRVSDEGGQPEWRADGQELFYVSPDRYVMAVDFREEGGEGLVSAPKRLFQIEEYSPDQDKFGVSHDGRRFLVKVPAGSARPSRVHVLLNWPSLLE